MVDHVTWVVIISDCDQPITTHTSLGKSTNTTFSASTFGTFNASSLGLVSVEVPNVPIITTSLEAPKEKRKPKCDFQWVFKDNWASKFPKLSMWLILMVRCSKCIGGSI